MKYLLLIISLLQMVYIGCDGGKTSSFTGSFDLPPSLATISGTQPSLSVYDSSGTTLLLGPASLTYNTETKVWTTELVGLPGGDYLASLDIDFIPSTAALKTQITQKIILGRATKTLSVPGDGGSATLTLDPADFDTTLDSDGDTLSNLAEYDLGLDPFVVDSDGDGFPDQNDLFPLDLSESIDEDRDGIGNKKDNCLSVANRGQENFEKDTQGDACDNDDDNDGLADTDETTAGSNPFDSDTDKDTVLDGQDNCPVTANADQADTDGDKKGNACDTDDDDDGIADTADNCPLAANADQTNTDGTGSGDACTGDDDGDTVLDGTDNCRLVSNANQTNTDGDGNGDACDSDDDNDGLLDTEENGLGVDHLVTDPLKPDTDGDGISDQSDNCPLVSNSSGQTSDTDSDGEGNACDCVVNDPNFKIRNAVFAATAANGGSDSNVGAQNNPVLTLAKAIQLAQATGSAIYVTAGNYSESVTLPSGMAIYGGFAGGTSCTRALASNNSTITSSAATTMTIPSVTSSTIIDGLVLRNTGTASQTTVLSATDTSLSSSNFLTIRNNLIFGATNPNQTSRAVSIQGTSPLFVNNVIDGGVSYSSVGLELQDSPAAKVIHNTIHGGQSLFSSTGLRIKNSSPILINNILLTENTSSGGLEEQIILDNLDNALPAGIQIQRNLVGGFLNPNVADPYATPTTPKLYRSARGAPVTTIAGFNSLDGSLVGGNVDLNISPGQLPSLLFNDYLNGDYSLKLGSVAINAGTNPSAYTGGMAVTMDRNNNPRPNGGGYDLGAYER